MAAKPDDALSRYLANRFPSTNLTPAATAPKNYVADAQPPEVLQPGQTPQPGHTYVPYEPGMGSGPGGTGPPTESGGGGGGGGGGGPNAPLDWRAYLVNWGFPQEIVDELDRIWRTYSDAGTAGVAALAYIRGTDWYKTTFPGIQEGEKRGLYADEQGYRSYTNDLNDIYHRYYGRDVTGQEVADASKNGWSASHVNAHFQGGAYIAANKGDIEQVLGAFDDKGQASDEELAALGDQQAGLDNALGPVIQRRIQLAQQRFQGAFAGVLASPSLGLTSAGKIAAPSLLGGRNPNDVAA